MAAYGTGIPAAIMLPLIYFGTIVYGEGKREIVINFVLKLLLLFDKSVLARIYEA